MSEQLNHNSESLKPITPESGQETAKLAVLEQRSEQAERDKPSVEAARAHVESQAPAGQEHPLAGLEKAEDTSADNVHWSNKELRVQAFDRRLKSVQRKLNPTEKSLSKFIHRPSVEKISEATGKTLARPSGILVGGICSFVFSLGAYLLAKQMGGTLSYGIFGLIFVAGFLLGLLIEAGLKFTQRMLALKHRS